MTFDDPFDLVISNAAERVCQPGLRIHAVELGGLGTYPDGRHSVCWA